MDCVDCGRKDWDLGRDDRPPLDGGTSCHFAVMMSMNHFH